jgi:uncharacterized protein involved in exopolysaccharide biosynthesis
MSESHPQEIVEARLPAFLRDPWGVLRRRWTFMTFAFLAILVACVAAIELRFTPTYKARATVLVSSQQFRENLLPTSVSNGAFDKISVMVGQTLASENLAALIEERDLYPALRPLLSPTELVSIMRQNVAIEAQASVAPQPQIETAGIFTISFRYGRPDLAADVANALATAFAESGVRLRRQQSQLATELLRDRLSATAAALAESEERVEQFRRQNRMALALGNTDELEENLAGLRARLAQESAAYTDDHPNIRSLSREHGNLSGQLASIHAKREELASLERRVTIARRAQRDALERVQEAELSERLDAAGERALASVLDRAVAPLEPERTRTKLLIAALGLALGVAAATGLLLELRDPVVITENELGEEFGLATLGGVPEIR